MIPSPPPRHYLLFIADKLKLELAANGRAAAVWQRSAEVGRHSLFSHSHHPPPPYSDGFRVNPGLPRLRSLSSPPPPPPPYTLAGLPPGLQGGALLQRRLRRAPPPAERGATPAAPGDDAAPLSFPTTRLRCRLSATLTHACSLCVSSLQVSAHRALFRWRDSLAREEDESCAYVLVSPCITCIHEFATLQ